MKTLFDDQKMDSTMVFEAQSFKSADIFPHPGALLMNAGDILASTSVEFGYKSPDMYFAHAGRINEGDILGSNCFGVGYQSSADLYLISSPHIKVGDVLGNISVEVSSISSAYSAISPYLKLGYRPENTIQSFNPSANLCSVSIESIGVEPVFVNAGAANSRISLFDPNSASTMIKLEESWRHTIHSFNSAPNLCSVSIESIGAERVFVNTGALNSSISLFDPNSANMRIESGDKYGNTIHSFNPLSNPSALGSARIVVDSMFVNTGDSVWNIGPGLTMASPSHSYQSICGSLQQSPPLSMVSAGEYLSRQCVLPEGFYAYSARGRKRRRFEVLLPLRFNDGTDVPAKMLEEAKRELRGLFGGVSWETQTIEGDWEDEGVNYPDTLKRVIVDAPDLENSRRSMQHFKERWRRRLGQVELYMTTSVVEII